MRYYIGVDWGDEEHAVWVEDEQGQRVSAGMVRHSPVGFSEWGRQLDEWRAQGLGLWAAIERPDGRVVPARCRTSSSGSGGRRATMSAWRRSPRSWSALEST